VIMARLRRRVLVPLIELYSVLDSFHKGESLRRCSVVDAPAEVEKLLHLVNALLDQRIHEAPVEPMVKKPANGAGAIERTALLEFLERESRAVILADERGVIIRANNAALEVMAGPAGTQVKAELSAVAKKKAPGGTIADARPLRDGSGWLCWVNAAAEVSEAPPAAAAGGGG
jgi:hypothetical protein